MTEKSVSICVPRVLLWSLIILCLAGTAYAQINTADLQGSVTDPAGAVVPYAKIKIENLQTGLTRETVSRENGDYVFLALPPGRYRVSIEAANFRPAVVENVALTIGQQAQLPFKLEISAVTEALVITADAGVVETTRSSIATTVDQRAIESLATNGRSYINFTLLDSATTRDNQPVLGPAPTSGLNIGGQRARANMVSIDGADAIDNTINGVRGTLSQEAVQEFQIIKSGYAPEYGRASSATINIVSKQGTNNWHGNLFGYLRSRHGSATNAFAGEPDPGDTRTQAGFTFGGPIRKDKTFVFGSFETNLRNSIYFSQVGRNDYGLKTVPNPFGPGSLMLTPQQENYVRSAPATLAAPYATIATQCGPGCDPRKHARWANHFRFDTESSSRLLSCVELGGWKLQDDRRNLLLLGAFRSPDQFESQCLRPNQRNAFGSDWPPKQRAESAYRLEWFFENDQQLYT